MKRTSGGSFFHYSKFGNSRGWILSPEESRVPPSPTFLAVIGHVGLQSCSVSAAD